MGFKMAMDKYMEVMKARETQKMIWKTIVIKLAESHPGSKLNKFEMYRRAMRILNLGTSFNLLNNVVKAYDIIYNNRELLA
jgi:hypothetical protein